MDEFPVGGSFADLGLPVSPTASTFDALETPTANQLCFTWSSDEIPILLYDDGYADDISISCMSSTTGGNWESSVALAEGRMSYGSTAMRRGPQASVVDAPCLSTLESSSSICSVGTFGPKKKKPTKPDETSPSRHRGRGVLSGSPPPSAVLPPPTSVSSMGSDEQPNTLEKGFVSRRRTSSTRTLSGIFASPTVLVTTKRESVSMANPRDSALFSPSLGNFERPYEDDPSADINDDSVTCLTPKKANLSGSISWISTRNWDCQQYKEYIAQEDLSRISPSMRISDDHSRGRLSPMLITPPRRRIPGPHNAVTKPRPLPIAYEIVDPKGIPFPPANPIRQTRDLDWLKDITVQFLVDQEGFRAAHPNFKFASIARLRSSQQSRSPNTIMAQFRPIIRQSFHFHYAPFESPPVLRRVTVDDDETYDYVSKQAHLTMKTNGVYVLHGHEISSTTYNPEASKLYWQFEYLVDDRLLDGSGKVMEGEKILTPLTFSCDPSLIRPGQGRRNNIMHVFKKGVAPKLVSEKLQPPGTVRPQNGTGNAGTLVSSQTDAHISHFFSSKAHTWNLHRRGQSNGVQQAEPRKLQDDRRALQPSPLSELRRSEHRLPRRRRASSSDENYTPTTKPHEISDHRHGEYSASGTQPSISLTRHIIPPAKLTELLGSPVRGPTRDASSIENSNHDIGGFVPLSPRPQHIHTKAINPVTIC